MRKFLSSILDKTEKAEGIIIKRPPEYENITEKLSQKSEKKTVRNTVSRIIDAEKILRHRKILVRKLVSNIVQCAAKREGMTIDFPPHYQYLIKQPSNKEHRKETAKSSINVSGDSLARPGSVSPHDRSMDVAGRHSAVLRAISSGRICLESAPEDAGHSYRNISPGKMNTTITKSLFYHRFFTVLSPFYHRLFTVFSPFYHLFITVFTVLSPFSPFYLRFITVLRPFLGRLHENMYCFLSTDGSESRADRFRNENLTMTASRVVIEALYHAISVVGTQKK